MYRPPTDPRERPPPSWRSLLVGCVLLAAIPFLFWTVDNPIVGSLVVAAVAGLVVGVPRGVAPARCCRDCAGFALDLGDAVRITVIDPRVDDPC